MHRPRVSSIAMAAFWGFSSTVCAHDAEFTFADIVDGVTPAVVSVSILGPRTSSPLFDDPLFRRLVPDQPSPWPAGSGVIIDADQGLLVTNHHVIRSAERVFVELKDRREFEAVLVGSDPATDIALLKIEATNIEELPLGNLEKLAVGDFVLAIGNPFNLGQTVTAGIVSALGRRGGLTESGYEDFIQTDASINRGNSGGALVDLEGQLVGINTAIITPTGANAGIGFAVPANIVRVITEQLLEFGDVRRGFLGVNMGPVTEDIAEALELDKAEGVVVAEVVAESGAERAGIEPGDVIVSVDGEDVVDPVGLRTRIGLAAVGEEVELGIIRDGAPETLTATLGEVQRASARAASSQLLAGARLRDLSNEHELYGRVAGVEVVDVEDGSRAAAAGLRSGDVIVGVNRRRVENVREFDDAIEGRQAAGLYVQRGNRRLFTWVR